jgi:membrane dipeptidase
MRELAARGGLLGLMLHPLAIGHESRTIDRVIDHLEHAVAVMGADRVCLGGDFTTRLWEVLPQLPPAADGLMPVGLDPGAGIEGLKGPQDYPALLVALSRRGWEPAPVEAIASRNLLALLRRALPG